MTNETDNGQPGVIAQPLSQLAGSATSNVVDLKEPLSNVKPAAMPAMDLVDSSAKQLAPVGGRTLSLGALSDIPIIVVFEVGCQDITLPQLMGLSRGAVVPLPDVYVDAIDVKVSGTTIAKAETINLKQRYGVRLSELVVPPELETD